MDRISTAFMAYLKLSVLKKNKFKWRHWMFTWMFTNLMPVDNNNNIASLLNTSHNWETSQKQSWSVQYHNFQDYGHTKNHYYHLSRYVKCDEDHHFEDCTKDFISTVYCTLCVRDHTVNFKGCSVFKSVLKHRDNNDLNIHKIIFNLNSKEKKLFETSPNTLLHTISSFYGLRPFWFLTWHLNLKS